MTRLVQKIEQLIRAVAWNPATPMRTVAAFDQLAYSIIGDIGSQESWMRDTVQNLYSMADWDSGEGPFDEPDAVKRSRTLLAQVGITGPYKPEEDHV